jgi:hypothetical protein
MDILGKMLIAAQKYGLETEVLLSFVKVIAPDLTIGELIKATNIALLEWDL